MAEAVGLAASITGLIAISTKIAQLAKSVYDSGKDAPKSILRIEEEMDNLHLIFCQVQVLVQTRNRPSKSRLAMIPVHHLVTILTGCMLYYSSLDEKLSGFNAGLAPPAGASNAQPTLRPTASSARIVMARVKWAVWTEAEVAVVIDNLERQKSSLHLMLTILHWYVNIFS